MLNVSNNPKEVGASTKHVEWLEDCVCFVPKVLARRRCALLLYIISPFCKSFHKCVISQIKINK